MTRSIRSLSLVFPVVALVALGVGGAGCDESSGGSAATTPSAVASASAAPVAPAPPVHAAFGRHGGIAAGLFHAANDLTLTATQKATLDKTEASLKADDDGIRTAMKSYRTDLIAGIKAGKLDTAKLTAADTVVDKAIADHQDKEQTALDSLHSTLDATQRTAVVAAVRAKQAEQETRMVSWISAKEADGGALDWNKKRLDKLTADLTLDAGQQKQVAAILTKASDPPNAAGMQARWDERKKREDALLTSFAGGTFDAKKADLTLLPGKTAHDPMDHMTTFFTQLLPILHPDQRDKLAASMDRPFGGHEGPGGPAGVAMRHPVDDMMFPFSEPHDDMGGGGGIGNGGMGAGNAPTSPPRMPK